MKKFGITLATFMMVVVLAGTILYAATSVFASTTKTTEDSQISININPIAVSAGPVVNSDLNKTSYTTKQQVNGIEIEIVGKQVVDNLLLVNICFQLPDEKDWLLGVHPDDIVLTVGDNTISHSGWSQIDSIADVNASANGKKTRCDQVKFQLSGQEDLSDFEVTVSHLVTSIPEIPDCNNAQAKLDKKNTGVKIKCSKTDSSFSYEVTQKPEKMNNYDLQQSIDSAFRDFIDGPWVLTDSLNNQ